MITNTEPLWSYLQDLRDSDMDAAVYPTRNGDRYALRVVDSEDPGKGLAFLAAFSSKLREADRPEDGAGRLKATKALNAMLNDEHAANQYVVCYCVIDKESLEKFPQYTEEDRGKTFLMIAGVNAAVSDEQTYADADKEPATAKSDSRTASGGRGSRGGRRVS